MGLLDSIKSFLNPVVISRFNDLYENHYEALKYSYATNDLSKNIPFNKKKEIVAKRENILRMYQQHLVRIEQKCKEKAVAAAAAKYPHAFIILCDRYIGGVLGETVKMPGTRTSKHELLKSVEQLKFDGSVFLAFAGEIRVYGGLYRHFAYSPASYNKDRLSIVGLTFGEDEEKIKYVDKIEDLRPTEIDKLYAHLDELPQEEESVLKKLKEENTRIDFEDNILYNPDNPQRAKYYKAFIDSIGDIENVKDYCVKHLSELDDYIHNTIHSEYERIKKTYRLGVTYYRRNVTGTRCKIEAEIVEDEEKIASLDSIYKKYCTLKRKYPIGLPAYEKYNSYDDGKNSTSLSLEEIVKTDETVLEDFEHVAPLIKIYDEWEAKQKVFTQDCRNENIDGWGCYKYALTFDKPYYGGQTIKGSYILWQLFCKSYSCDQNVDLQLYPSAKINYTILHEFKECTRHFINSVYDKIFNFIQKLKSKYGDIAVVFGDSGLDNPEMFNNYHFHYLKDLLSKNGISIFDNISLVSKSCDTIQHLVFVELISTNGHMIDECQTLLRTAIGHPCLTFISLEKGYDTDEINEIIENKRKEIQKKEEEHKKKEEEVDEISRQKQEEIKALKSKVVTWNTLSLCLPYTYLLRYYPTTCDFEATEDEWADRWLVWNFKNTPGKTSSLQHEQALNNLLPRLTSMLKSAFGDKLQLLTLVCIPAASKVNNNARFEVFSERLAIETNMYNAFGHIQVVKDATPKHLGGTGTPVLHFDESYFHGRYILLFDDVITKGNSMLRFKSKLETLGATVIAGVSIGKTTHER